MSERGRDFRKKVVEGLQMTDAEQDRHWLELNDMEFAALNHFNFTADNIATRIEVALTNERRKASR